MARLGVCFTPSVTRLEYLRVTGLEADFLGELARGDFCFDMSELDSGLRKDAIVGEWAKEDKRRASLPVGR
jgi:hypothetical protein